MYLEQSQVKEKPYLPSCDARYRLRHSDPLIRAIAIEGYQRLIQLIARHLTNQTRRNALTIASGIVSTLMGAVALAEIAPEDSPSCLLSKNSSRKLVRRSSQVHKIPHTGQAQIIPVSRPAPTYDTVTYAVAIPALRTWQKNGFSFTCKKESEGRWMRYFVGTLDCSFDRYLSKCFRIICRVWCHPGPITRLSLAASTTAVETR